MSEHRDRLRDRLAAMDADQRARLAERLRALPVRAASRGPRLAAFIETRNGTIDAAELRAFLRRRLPEYMIPATIAVVERLPRTPAGKIDVNALPAESTGPAPSGFSEPVTESEILLARIWSDVLGGVRVDVHDNFFEIGGDSILSIQIVARAAREGLRIEADQLFRHQTVSELARVAVPLMNRPAPTRTGAGPVPLTPIQHWFFEQPLPRPEHWHHILWLEAPAGFDTERFRRSLELLVRRHDVLRLRFEHLEGTWRQEYAPSTGALRMHEIDATMIAPTDLAATLEAAADDLAADTDLATSPALAVLVVTRDGTASRIALIVHHLVIDLVSWRILLDDLEAIESALAADREPALPPVRTSFGAWADLLSSHAHSDAAHAEIDFWTAMRDVPAVVPRDRDGTFTESSARVVTATLEDSWTTALFDDVLAVGHNTVEEVLLTAIIRTIAGWTGHDAVLLGIERHGRDALGGQADLTHTIGWFTAWFPLLVRTGELQDPDASLRAVQQRLRAVPRGGIGYGLLRYLSPPGEAREAMAAVATPQVMFNYSGRANLLMAPRIRPIGVPRSSRAAENQRSSSIEINAFRADGALVMHWGYSESIHARETIERIAERSLDDLRTLVDHCRAVGSSRLTPTDFPEAGLTQDELDGFLRQLDAG